MSVPQVKRQINGHSRNRRRVVAVIGSGRTSDEHASEIGELIASLGFDLLTGGGRGVMEAVSRAFFEKKPRVGLVVGIIPAEVRPLSDVEERSAEAVEYRVPPGYPNEWVELAIYTHLPDSGEDGLLRSSRNHINVLSADAIVALPGREGTLAEMWLAVQYGVPVITYGEHREEPPPSIRRATSLEEVRDFLLDQLSVW